MSPEKSPLLIHILNHVAKRFRHIIVVPIEENAIYLSYAAANAAPIYRILAPPQALVRSLSDKWNFHTVCIQAGITVPDTLLLASSTEATVDRLRVLGDRIVVKPTIGGGGLGVFVSTPATFITDLQQQGQARYPLLVQRFIDGEDIDLSLLASNGKILLHAIQIATPSGLVFFENDELLNAGRRLIEAAGYSGLVHFDARRERISGRIYLIEANTRIWASMFTAALAGMNFLGAALGAAEGDTTVEPKGLTSTGAVTWGGSIKQTVLAGFGRSNKASSRRNVVLRGVFDPVQHLVLRRYITSRERTSNSNQAGSAQRARKSSR
jgi:predicted ATP-grasp superfamily ATP-dependent carboligase